MTKRYIGFFLLISGLNAPLFAQNYSVSKIRSKRIEITKYLDANPDIKDAESLLAPYKEKVDSFIGPVIGNSDIYMEGDRPESLLSNWTADVILEEAREKFGKIDFSVINIGGLRSVMPKGEVRRGDIIDIAPFQNNLVILTLKGSDVMELFNQFTIYGGEGVSHGINIDMDLKNHTATGTLNGKKIKKNKVYKIATLDYLAEGNDNMKAFKNAIDIIRTESPVRETYINFIKKQTAQGKTLTSKIEGRITIKVDKK